MVIRLRLQKDVTTLNYLKKSVRNILVNVKINLTRSLKPTQAQGLCGLICCAICQHKKLLLRKNIKKNGRKAIDRHMVILIYVDSPENQVYRQVNGPPGILSL